MARIPILKKDGTPTGLFWSDSGDEEQQIKRVYRTSSEGRLQRSKSIRFDTRSNKLQRV